MLKVVETQGAGVMTQKTSPAQRSIRRHLLGGLAVVALLAGGVGGLAATTELAGAVIAPGSLVVDTNVKKVQHPTGGVVGELRVRDGDRVKAGDIVVRLDETITQANLAIVVKSLNELRGAARAARGRARRHRGRGQFPAELLARSADPEVARMIEGERNLFELRRTARAGQKAQLKERIAQLREEIQGLTGQAAAKKREIELIGQELEGVRDLWRKNLVQIQRVTALERDAARLEGERGQLIAATAQSKGKISEIELQIIQIDQDLRSEVAKELREVQGKIAELVERKVAAEDQLKRIDIRAPQDGIVHQLAVHTRRRRDHRRRGDHADRAGDRRPDGRGEARAAGHRPGQARAAGGAALLRLQPAHDARDQRRRSRASRPISRPTSAPA